MRRSWMCLTAVASFLAAPVLGAGAQNPNNELFLQSFVSGSTSSILTQIFAPNVTFAAGTGFDIRQFNGTTLGPSLFYQVAATSLVNGNLVLTPNLVLAANMMYAVVLEINPGSQPTPSANVDNAFAGGNIFTRSSVSAAWVKQDVDIAGFSVATQPVTTTPEPASLVLIATGLISVAGFTVRRRRAYV